MSGIDSAEDGDIISVGPPLPRIGAVEPAGDFRAKVEWSRGLRAGKTEIVDLTPAIMSHPHYTPLRNNPELFATVRVIDDGTGIEWDQGVELSAIWIERLPTRTMTNEAFRAAMDRLGMTLDGMSATLGIARRVIADYRKDKPIPPYVALAVSYLLERRSP